MRIRLNVVAAMGVLMTIALLACSPSVVLQGLMGESPTQTQVPTRVAFAATPSETSTLPTITVSPSTPTNTPTPSPIATLDTAPSPTAPPVLQLRTDLPALALRDWPRPANDNGRCIHFLPTGYYTQRDFDIQIPRLKDLQMRWVLALYSDLNQLRLAATQFKAAGIVPIWRFSMRAYQRHYDWNQDVQILKEVGLPPYFQLYNEPDSGSEWDGRDVNEAQWISNFVQTAKDVYNAGGYVGLQLLDPDWTRAVLREIKAEKGERIFGRMFFVPHSYALNHPPGYIEDENGVLGYRYYLDVFQQELGFIPPFIVGEGGWKYHATDDNRFPIIADQLHAQYHRELFDWFRIGKVSDGQPLPDYLFAFCPWIMAGQLEGAAWYDSFEGDRTLTISEVKKIPIFTRKFSWDKK